MPEPFPCFLNVVSTDADALAGALRAEAAEHAAAGEIDWLSPDYAFDLPFLDEPGAVPAAARAVADGAKADINVVPAANRRKKLLIADMESTIIDCECIDELADFAGLKDRIAPITERTMRGEIDFRQALRERVALLKELPASVLEQVYRERVHLNPGASELVATMKANGAYTMLVSGGFGFFAERVARECGFDTWQANTLEIADGKLTGTVGEPILDRDAKLRALEHATRERGLSLGDAAAIGDGANDLAMIGAAGLGVGYYPKPVLAAAAKSIIARTDLRTLLYLQGYRDTEIVR